MSASSEVSISYNFHFILERMSSFSLLHKCMDEKWICTKFTRGKYVAKLWKLTGKGGVNSKCTYQFTWSCKLERERPLIIRIRVVHSEAFQGLVLLKCTAVKTNKKTIGLFILPSSLRLLLILHISWHFCDMFVRQGRSKMIFCCFKQSF